MSAVVKTATPFVIESVLFDALEKLGSEPQRINAENHRFVTQLNQIQMNDILTNREDYNGRQLFRLFGERWVLMHDSHEYNTQVVTKLADRRYAPVAKFLAELSLVYEQGYQQLLEKIAETERQRLEQERKERVESMRQQAIIKAKAQGYSVKENRTAAGQIQLVLTRTV